MFPPLRVAVGQLGVDAHRRGASAAYRRESTTRPIPTRCARKSKRDCAPLRRRSAPPSRPDRTSSIPRETRALLGEFAEDAQRILRSQLGKPRIPYLP
jgi:hypothetical protein